MSQDTSSKIPQSDPYIPVQAPGTPQHSLLASEIAQLEGK